MAEENKKNKNKNKKQKQKTKSKKKKKKIPSKNDIKTNNKIVLKITSENKRLSNTNHTIESELIKGYQYRLIVVKTVYMYNPDFYCSFYLIIILT
jgi:hypothetical protein